MKSPKEPHHKDADDTKDVEHGSIPPLGRQLHHLVDNTEKTQYSSHEIRNMRKSLISPRTVGYGIHMTASLLAKLTPADENEHDGEDSLENHEIDETNAEQVIVPGSYEAKNVDDPRNGAKALEKDLTVPDREILYEFQDDIILKDPVVPHELDNIRRGKDHEVACGQQRSEGFINTDDIFSHSIYMMAEINETENKPTADTTQSHWDIVTTAGENEHGEEDSLKNHEPNVNKGEQAIMPGID